MITIQQIQDTTLINEKSKAWALDNLDYLNSTNKLLGSSIKVEKGESAGYYTSILYMQPHDKVSTITLCAGASASGCAKPCLIGSGMLGMTTGQNAATRRTILFILDTVRFYEMLMKECISLYKKHGDKLAVRLNGTTDIDFSEFIASIPFIRFYDYTKVYARLLKNKLANYDLTYSGSAYTEKAIQRTARAVTAGYRVAIAFNTGEKAGEFKIPAGIADFDSTDLRFTDAHTLGALKYKGGSKAKRAATSNDQIFFYTLKTYNNLQNLIATDV